MTEQEAIKELNSCHAFGLSSECRSLAKLALEKQIPKKPMVHPDNKRLHYCPGCNSYFGALIGINCCMDCGQRLDWT